MSSTILVGRRLIPVEHIALVEPFDPAANPRMQSARAFQARLVLIDRESVLTEESVTSFVEAHGFRMLPEESVATNPVVRFAVEKFEGAADGFNPTKPYRTRLQWRDSDGNVQSKLLLTKPETVLAIVVKGEAEEAGSSTEGDARDAKNSAPPGQRRRSRRKSPSPIPA